MGVETSRQSNLPENLDSNYELYKNSWLSSEYISRLTNRQQPLKSTLSEITLENAATYFVDFFSKHNDFQPKILEIMAGNGIATNIFQQCLKNVGFNNYTWISTELQNFSPQNPPISIKFDLHSVEAVEKYGTQCNVLLMISPPPCSSEVIAGYGDYFAIKKWTEITDPVYTNKYITIVGEFGASDGSSGMYKYMLENPNWELVSRNIVYSGTDIFGGEVEKEIFIFKNS
jgi:hypothetical protein